MPRTQPTARPPVVSITLASVQKAPPQCPATATESTTDNKKGPPQPSQPQNARSSACRRQVDRARRCEKAKDIGDFPKRFKP